MVELLIESGEYDEDDISIRESYSGHHSYGRQTTGIKGITIEDITNILLETIRSGDFDVFEDISECMSDDNTSKLCCDQLGLSTIVY